MVGEIGIHDNHKVASRELQAVDICRSESELSSARLQQDLVGAISLDELLSDVLSAVGRSVVDDDEFPIEIAKPN